MIPYAIYDKATGEVIQDGVTTATALFRTRAKLPETQGLVANIPLDAKLHKIVEREGGQPEVVRRTKEEVDQWETVRKPPAPAETQYVSVDELIKVMQAHGIPLKKEDFKTLRKG